MYSMFIAFLILITPEIKPDFEDARSRTNSSMQELIFKQVDFVESLILPYVFVVS